MTLPNHWMTAEGSGTVVFPFLTIQGALFPTRPTFEREVRPGVNGIGIWSTGNRGEPFQIATTLDCVSIAAAGTAFAAYLTAVLTKKDLYYCGAFWGTVVVQGVVLQQLRTFKTGVGGVQAFTGAAGTLLAVNWTLETLP
jgi:hypothetical protein